MPDAEHRLPRVTARATAGGLRAISGGSLSTHNDRDRSRLGGSVTFTLGTVAEDRPSRSGSFLRRSMTRQLDEGHLFSRGRQTRAASSSVGREGFSSTGDEKARECALRLPRCAAFRRLCTSWTGRGSVYDHDA